MWPIEKWRIAALTTVGIGVCVLLILLVSGLNEDNLRLLLRVTARSSLLLFLLAFGATSMHLVLRNSATAWTLKNRRYLGVSFAISHFIHLGFIVWLAMVYPEPFFSNTGLSFWIVGGTAYLFITAMAITSFEIPRKWLGEKKWSLLHTTGGYLVLFVFFQAYVPKAFMGDLFRMPFAAAILLVVVLRFYRIYRRKTQT